MSKPDAPAPPDYVAQAKEQGVANVEAARVGSKLSNPSWENAYGSRDVIYGYGGDQDAVHIIDKMSPAEQAKLNLSNNIERNLLNTAQAGLNRVSGAMATPFDISKVRESQGAPTANWTANEDTRKSVANSLMSRLDPQFARDEESTRSRLANQGITQGSEAYNREMESLNNAKTDARMQADIQAGQEQSRLAGLESQNFADRTSSYNSSMQGRQQDIQEQAYLRSLPLNELNALRTGNQATAPQFQQFSGQNVAAAPLLQGAQLSENAAMDRYNAKMQSRNALIQGGAQLGAAFATGGASAAGGAK